MPQALRSASPVAKPGSRAGDALESALGKVPRLDIISLDPAVDLEAAKARLVEEPPPGGSVRTRLALIVVQSDAVVRAEGADRFGSYDFFVRAKLDDRLIDEVSDGIRDAIIDARVRGSGLDRREVDALTKVDRVASRTVTAAGEEGTNRVLNMVMPAAFMGLLLVSVMLSGQYLLTTTVEEKTNRVVEVLLSAVSPMELMAGKILGQMAVGLLVLTLYAGLGIMALMAFASFGLLDPMLIGFLLVFCLLAYLSMGAIMAAIGSAVNEMREAEGRVSHAAAALAGIPGGRGRRGRRLRVAVGRGEGLPHRAVDVRQAADVPDAGALGADGVKSMRQRTHALRLVALLCAGDRPVAIGVRASDPAGEPSSPMVLALLGGPPHRPAEPRLLRIHAGRDAVAARRVQRPAWIRADEQRAGPG